MLSPSPDAVAGGVEKPRPDLVLVTVNEHETKAVHDAFLGATRTEGIPVSLEGRLYHNLGIINGTTVYHAISEMGSSGPGAMQQVVDKAIRALDPAAVIAVGIAFGVSEKDQSIGDILLSKQIQLYELQRAGREIVLRGDKPHATTRLINHFEAFKQVRWKGATVRTGLILSGEKLIDDKDYRDQLVTLQVEAVGGEMEGAGLYVASADHKVDWVVVKAICDWADGNKKVNKKQRQKKAAKNAAKFIVESLKYAPLKRIDTVRPTPHTSDIARAIDPVGSLPPFEKLLTSDPHLLGEVSTMLGGQIDQSVVAEQGSTVSTIEQVAGTSQNLNQSVKATDNSRIDNVKQEGNK
jgi:nucleoside phosphorylase